MPWLEMGVAFLAGYGLMSLVLWFCSWLGRLWIRPLTTTALILAKGEEERIEGVLRSVHKLWEDGRIVEVLVLADGSGASRDIVNRLSGSLPGTRLLPQGTDPVSALEAAAGQTAWIINLDRIPAATRLGECTLGAPLHH